MSPSEYSMLLNMTLKQLDINIRNCIFLIERIFTLLTQRASALN